eukprot:3266257-Rhodomonas_salina.1
MSWSDAVSLCAHGSPRYQPERQPSVPGLRLAKRTELEAVTVSVGGPGREGRRGERNGRRGKEWVH